MAAELMNYGMYENVEKEEDFGFSSLTDEALLMADELMRK
jgi:hypothetical protein